jgi:hypothetical protein
MEETPMKRIFVLFFSLLFILTSFLVSQELDCKVTINIDKIQSSQRDYLRNFTSDIERYLNNTRFTNEDLDGEKISCNMEILFNSGSRDNRYQVQVVIASQRPVYIKDQISNRTSPVLRIADNNWEFTYMPNQRMNHDEMIFDPLTGFLDFYAYLIIGYDLETYIPMSGNSCFQKALNIIRLAANSASNNDWKQTTTGYSKFGISDELTNIKYESFRSALNNYHYDGIDLLATEPKKAQDNILKAIESINEVRNRQNSTSVIVKQFFDAKYREIAEAFQTYTDRSVYDKLSNYDQEHRSTYQEAKTKP